MFHRLKTKDSMIDLNDDTFEDVPPNKSNRRPTDVSLILF